MRSQKQSSNILTRKWKQFTCLHRWHKGFEIGFDMFKGYLYPYDCDVCDKRIFRWSIDYPPISGILPTSPWGEYKKDPLYNVSPPTIYKD